MRIILGFLFPLIFHKNTSCWTYSFLFFIFYFFGLRKYAFFVCGEITHTHGCLTPLTAFILHLLLFFFISHDFFLFSSTTNKLIFGTTPSFEWQPVFQWKLLLYCSDVAFIKWWPSLAIHDQSPSPLIFESLSGVRVEVRCTAVKCIALCDKFVSHLWKKKGIYSDSR